METETPAERYYKNHLKRVSDYQKANPEKVHEKYIKQRERLKEDKEKYELFLQQKREYYHTHKQLKQKSEPEEILL